MGNDPEAVLTTLARRQFGLVARCQIEHLMTRSAIEWRLSSGDWEPVARGVYRLKGAPDCWRQRALAATLAAGPEARLSHQTAAFLYRLDGLREQPAVLHLTLPIGRRLRHHATHVHRSVEPLRAWWIHGLPTTLLARTLVDLATVLPPLDLEIALDSAQRRFQHLSQWLTTELARLNHRGRTGVALLEELLACRLDGATDSALEVVARRRMKRFGIPTPTRQLELFDAAGYVLRADFAWRAWRVVLHVDGYRWHHARERFERDRAQRNRLTLAGWHQLMVTWRDLESDDWLHALAALLARTAPQRDLPLWPTSAVDSAP